MKKRNQTLAVMMVAIGGVLVLASCQDVKNDKKSEGTGSKHFMVRASIEPTLKPTVKPTAEPTVEPTVEPTTETTMEATKVPATTATPNTVKKQSQKTKRIVIDPGHQLKQDSAQEPIAPGASETKKRVTSGTEGRFTKVPEYKVTLEVSKQLKKELEKKGYEVILTREKHAVNISNIERAQVANKANADAFIRIHCNGVDNASVHGALTLCPTKNSPYCKAIAKDSYSLSKDILDEMTEATGAANRGVTRTDTMSGINWSKVPVTIVEMGYMTNKKEDENLVSPEYQAKIVKGIVAGVEKYFSNK